MDLTMDSETIKAKMLNGDFDEVEQAGKLPKALSWFIKKLASASERAAQGLSHEKPPSAFMNFILESGVKLEPDNIVLRAKNWQSQMNKSDSASMSDDEDITPIRSKDGSADASIVSPSTKSVNESQNKRFIVPSATGSSSSVSVSPMQNASEITPISAKANRSANKASIKKKVVKAKTVNTGAKKKVKDPNAPKAKKSAYDYFAIEQRILLKETRPNLQPKDILVAIGEAWRNTSDAAKASFQRQSQADSERYRGEMEAYKMNHPDVTVLSKASVRAKAARIVEDPTENDEPEVDSDSAEAIDDTRTNEVKSLRQVSKRAAALKTTSYCISEHNHDVSSEDDEKPAAQPLRNTSPLAPLRADMQDKARTKSSIIKEHKNRVEKASKASVSIPAGIKQSDLPTDDDLLNAELTLHRVAPFPPDYIPLLGTDAVLILAPYREFLNSFQGLRSFSSEKLRALEAPCAQKGSILRGLVMRSEPNTEADMQGTSVVVLRDANGTLHTVLYAGFSSPLLLDEFLLDAARYDSSLRQSFLQIGAQVRKLFACDATSDQHGNTGQGRWIEGSIYSISPTMRTDPYLSIRVVWLSQELKTNDWVFAYTQTDCEVSPWDLHPSEYVLEAENAKRRTLPAALRVGALLPVSVLDYFSSLDFTDIFRYKLNQVQEFCQMFPKTEDQIDLHVIGQWLRSGRYEGEHNSSALGICTLLRDLDRMVSNAKRFNQCNRLFLPWRLADMAEHALIRLRADLIAAHPALSAALSQPAVPKMDCVNLNLEAEI